MAEPIISPQFSLLKSLPPARTILTGATLIFLAWAFFSGQTMKFYASIVFSFYSLTHSMWISVILLGIFQTLLLIPFRIINLTKSKHIKDFEAKINEIRVENDQSFLIKKSAKTGNRIILYYLIDFFVQLTSYVSIGRLFLTDFYTEKLNPWFLYSFVPYPSYPLNDVWFKIPYVKILSTHDYGWGVVLIVWAIVAAISFLTAIILRKQKLSTSLVARFLSTSLLLIFILTYILIRHFPASATVAIFSGDVSKPFPPLNLITALGTFFTILWLDINPILKKGELAKAAGIEEEIIRKTQVGLLTDSLRSATVVGLGAYFITNHIPCAFELSIFTLEIISWLSPLTLDKLILKTKTNANQPKEEVKPDDAIAVST